MPSSIQADAAPLILTLDLDPDQQARFDRLRAAHFPAERNYLSAHVSLFHHLPAGCHDGISVTLRERSALTSPFPVAVTGLRSLGRGVAYTLESQALSHLRSALARMWWDDLTAQDRQGYRPHITIQNKVDPAVARALLARLSAGFARFDIRATGLLLWRYRGGPWEPAGHFPFTYRPAAPPEPHHR